jgi:hypothetical protein
VTNSTIELANTSRVIRPGGVAATWRKEAMGAGDVGGTINPGFLVGNAG